MAYYNQIFLDFDGVICDSNYLKKQNIQAAASNYLPENEATEFVKFFTANNGIPRERKIFRYFPNKALAQNILNLYNNLNQNLLDAPIIDGLPEFLRENNHIPKYILSGGDRSEIENYLIQKSIREYFIDILCGPKTKEENLGLIDFIKPVLFIGDSVHDYEVSRKFDLDFIFLYGASQVVDANDIKFPGALFIRNFLELNNYYNEED